MDYFWNGCLVLEGKADEAEKLQSSIFKMWTLQGVKLESIDYTTMKIISPYYMIRPEAIESTHYVWKVAGDEKYYEMGKPCSGLLKILPSGQWICTA